MWDVIVIGAGAAGLFCASVASQRGQRVLVLDHAQILGEKIRISGGGRCNFTNRDSQPHHFLSLNPHFCKSALARFSPQDFISLVRSYRIGFHEKHRGQLFCDDSAMQIVDMLLAECARGGAVIRHPVQIGRVSPCQVSAHSGGAAAGWQVDTSAGIERTRALVMATGGLPVPAIGATGFALDLARSLDIAVVEPRPALVPLSFTSESFAGFDTLAGLSVPVQILAGRPADRYGSCTFQEDLLFTHKGLSGPAILQASSYWREGETVEIDWLNGADVEALCDAAAGARRVESVVSDWLPSRLARVMVDHLGQADKRWADCSKKDRQLLKDALTRWVVKPAGTLGWKKAEVMLGGVDTRTLESQSMQSRQHPGLYFIGECVDVTGHLGGHNFQWAWASGYACAQALSTA